MMHCDRIALTLVEGLAMNEETINQQAAEQIILQRKWRGKAFAWGEHVALLDGDVVAVAKTAEDAIQKLRSLDADPKRGMVIEVTPDLIDVV
jgi:hypothetical protein